MTGLLLALVLNSAVVSITLGQTNPLVEPKKCCLDRQFSVSIGEIGGKAYPITGNSVFLDGVTYLAYDFYKQMIGAESHMRQPDGSDKVTRTLLDYNTMRMYVDDSGVCSILNITEPMEDPCVPANATYMGEVRFGYGTASLEVNTWEFERASGNSRILVRRSYTKTSCVPVIETYYGTVDGASTDVSHFFVNFKPGIDNPSDLVAPSAVAQSYCNDYTGQKPVEIVG
ncbi:hypothetical protein EGW08_017323 [Elysia chlorotica]|uniref:Uncharacterized protein n=1 Tax=Elysia chlorotica TaxID=188477 RepID=A0A433T041_ELYCH|nr:hypothetical protein EGW08_017323 [Elysia chlorotica]